jgi:hypothetical protein
MPTYWKEEEDEEEDDVSFVEEYVSFQIDPRSKSTIAAARKRKHPGNYIATNILWV